MKKLMVLHYHQKKKFCILKIWMNDCTLKDPEIFIDIDNLFNDGCLFKKHNPEF